MKRFANLVLKFGVTIGIFAAIFVELGGGYQLVRRSTLSRPEAFEVRNPDYPGIVGRLRARLLGVPLPRQRVPTSIDEVCWKATERPVFVRLADGSIRRFKPLRHCTAEGLTTVYVRGAGGDFVPVPLANAPEEVYFRIQGFQLVPAELSELWAEIRSVRLAVFIPWFLAAMVIKLLGIIANVGRWAILLRGQRIHLRFGYLTSTYFIGRYFGIVTPSTMGLDAWRLYETIRLTKRPVECTTVIAVERVIGLVGLLTVILLFMPFAARLTQGQSFGELLVAMKVPLAATVLFAVLILLQPTWFRGLLRFVPHDRVRRFLANVIDSATAYADRRWYLLLALLLAVFGQVTTTLMYFANAMSLATENVHGSEVLFASAIMTFGTFVVPSASGEGVRELVFVWLLGSRAGAAKAFLIGNLGFWIEKVPLSVPGGVILLLRRDPRLRAVSREELERMRQTAHADRGP